MGVAGHCGRIRTSVNPFFAARIGYTLRNPAGNSNVPGNSWGVSGFNLPSMERAG